MKPPIIRDAAYAGCEVAKNQTWRETRTPSLISHS
jgi:hypothetical protein